MEYREKSSMGERVKGIYRVKLTNSICGIMLIIKINFDLTLSSAFLSMLEIFDLQRIFMRNCLNKT